MILRPFVSLSRALVPLTCALAVSLTCALAPPAARADDRIPVELPPQIRDAFLAEMRGHLGNLDDILSALAAGDTLGYEPHPEWIGRVELAAVPSSQDQREDE